MAIRLEQILGIGTPLNLAGASQLSTLTEATTAADTDNLMFELAAGALRRMTVANAKVLFAGAGGGAVTPDPTDSSQWILEAAMDYSGYFDGFSSDGVGHTTNNSGGSLIIPGTAEQGRNAYLILRAGTGATSFHAFSSHNWAVFGGDKRAWRMHFRFKTDTIPDATNNYRYRIGWADDLRHGGSIFNGLYLAMERAENTSNFVGVCIDSATKTATSLGQAFATSTWYNGYIEVNAAGDSVDMEVRPEGTPFSAPTTMTTNIPTNTLSAMFRGFEISKLAGSLARTMGLESYQLYSKAAP